MQKRSCHVRESNPGLPRSTEPAGSQQAVQWQAAIIPLNQRDLRLGVTPHSAVMNREQRLRRPRLAERLILERQ